MSKVIRISETTYRRLEKHVNGFDDTPDKVIAKLLEIAENGQQAASAGASTETNVESENGFDADDAPDLTHTHRVGGTIGRRAFDSWADLMREAHKLAYDKLQSFERVQEISKAHIREGSVSSKGFKPVPGTPFSMQGANSNTAWRHSLHIAKELRLPLKVSFRWFNKKQAYRRGQAGRMEWSLAS